MARVIVNRLVLTIPLLLLVTMAAFLIGELTPGARRSRTDALRPLAR
jgi:hypothetical protein